MDFIMVPTIMGIIAFFTYKIFELFARRRERILLIEKLTYTELTGNIKADELQMANNNFNALKLGCLLVGIGLGLLIGFIICMLSIPNSIEPTYHLKQTMGIVYGSCTLIFGGLGLLIAFIIELKLPKKQ